MTSICRDCLYMRRDLEFRERCYSPQLYAMSTPGIPCTFERDDAIEEGRSHDDGTGKCGPQGLNRRVSEGV